MAVEELAASVVMAEARNAALFAMVTVDQGISVALPVAVVGAKDASRVTATVTKPAVFVKVDRT